MFLWLTPDDYPEKLIGTHERHSVLNRFLYQMGFPVEPSRENPIVRFQARVDELSGFGVLASDLMVPLVSTRLREELCVKCPSDVEVIDALVVGTDGSSTDFSLLNVTRRVRAIDHARSRYSLIPGTQSIAGFEKLVLLKRALGGRALAREEEYLPHLLVSEDLGHELLALDLNGLGLVRPDEMTW